MLAYILKATLCWAVFYLLYHFLLRRETFFRLNRWYLIGAAFFGLAIPAIDLRFLMGETAAAPMAHYLQPVTIGVHQLEAVIITASSGAVGFDWWQLLSGAYFAGAAFAFAKFAHGLFQIFRLRQKGKTEKGRGYLFVSTQSAHVPFSFFNHLFWSEKFAVENAVREAILRHEEAHIFQKHSFDVMLMELLGVVFWCSPPIYFFKKAVKTNHEYLADEAVLQNESRKNYGRLLLRQFQPSPQLALSNSLFSSQLKNRIIMMTKTKSAKTAALKYLAGLPLLALLIMAFSFAGEKPSAAPPTENGTALMPRDTAPDGEIFKEVDENPRFPGCDEVADAKKQKLCSEEKMLSFIYTNIKYPAQARENGTQGMVVVKFVVEKDGSISSPEIARSIGGGCDEEVLRVIKLMPDWVPGKQDGETVRVQFVLPVRFKLEDDGPGQSIADRMPLFPWGCKDGEGTECAKKQHIRFITENLKYPEASKKAGVEGLVVASFTITADGTLTGAKVVKSLDEHCDAEVLRVLNAMPKWAPGMKDGKPVDMEMKLPFKFALENDESVSAPGGAAKNMASQIELFRVYPNPASDVVFVKFKTETSPVSIRLTDASGKELATKKVDHDGGEQTVEVEAGKLPRGTVFVSLANREGEILETATVVLK